MGISVIDNHLSGINFANCFCCSVFVSVILVALLMKKYHNSEIRSFILFTFFTVTSMWTDVISYMCVGKEEFRALSFAVNVLSYSATVFAASAFYCYIMAYFEERRGVKSKHSFKIASFIYAVLCSGLYMSSVWNNLFFYIDENSIYHSTDLSFITAIVMIPIVIMAMIVIFKYRNLTSKRDTVIHSLYIIISVVMGYVDSVFIFTMRHITTAVLIVLIYIFIDIARDKELAENEKNLAISELNALRLQMNPHFVYNTLASIDALVVVDPKSARDLIAKFTKHLRSSYLDNSPTYVAFSQELENIKCYLAVEEVRFPDIEIEYDLKVTDFNIPPLTIQPIVENAIKHGICKIEDGSGIIKISTYENESNYFVKITDNGVGFDTSAPKKNDGRAHIGIDNANKRLELICNGKLNITSQIGVGTQALITIPKENI